MRELVNREGQVWTHAHTPGQLILITRSYVDGRRGGARCHEVYDVDCQESYVLREVHLDLPNMVRLS